MRQRAYVSLGVETKFALNLVADGPHSSAAWSGRPGAGSSVGESLQLSANSWAIDRNGKETWLLFVVIQVLGDRFPIVILPAYCQVGCTALRKTGMVEDKLGSRTQSVKLELNDRIDTRSPAIVAPRLDYALIRYKLDVSSRDVACE